MYRLVCIVLVNTFLVSCSQETNDANNRDDQEMAQPGVASQGDRAAPADRSFLSGESAYYIACGSCHETGQSGAPVTGDPDAWSNRSSLWQAVLADHANKGYMDMPAKGGRVELSEWVVIRATEYMLSQTYPELPPE